jgi:drug/metabolite transporter (DMT)-like permease
MKGKQQEVLLQHDFQHGRALFRHEHMDLSMHPPSDMAFVDQLRIPVLVLVCGSLMAITPRLVLVMRFTLFLGASMLMNIFMKALFSTIVVSESLGLYGFPAAFVVTALQMISAFVLFVSFVLVSQLTPWAYKPKRLETWSEWFAVFVFSGSFAANIALNNYSLSLIGISINLVIRSCIPFSAYITQVTLGRALGQGAKEQSLLQLALMTAGVLCSVLAVVANKQGGHGTEQESDNLLLGVCVCAVSTLMGGVTVAIAGALGTSCKLSPLDTVAYMSIPACSFLLGPIIFMSHPTNWEGRGSMTDAQIFLEVFHRAPSAIGLALLSGVLALGHNVLQYTIVQALSATHAAFAGNFNKAATIALSLVLGLEFLPTGIWAAVMICAIIGNVFAFTMYNLVDATPAKH